MPQTHYPKTENNIICAWVWPRPPVMPPFKASMPNFAATNLADRALAAGNTFVAHHSALGCTRLYTSFAADQPLEISFEFSNDEIGPDGSWVTDATLPLLNWDVLDAKTYKVGDHKGNWILILGRWLRVTVKNTGTKSIKEMRVYCRGSVF
jgi:hypothetical protein